MKNTDSRFKALVEKIGKEKVDSIAKKVLAMDLHGPLPLIFPKQEQIIINTKPSLKEGFCF